MRDIVDRARDALDAWDAEGQDDGRMLELELFGAVDDVVDEVGGPKPYATMYEKLAVGATVFHATLAFEVSLAEGGLAAYFESGAATGLPEATAAYRRIGAHAFAELTEQVSGLFPRGRAPRELSLERELALEIAEDDIDEIETAFDAAFEREDPHRLRLEYLAQTPGDFEPKADPDG